MANDKKKAAESKSSTLSWVVFLVVAAVVLGTVVVPALNRAAVTRHATVGKPAPDFTLTSLDGNKVTLSQLKGKPVLINFWATWCPPCRLEMPALQKVYQESSANGFMLLMVNQQEDSVTVQNFLKQNNYSLPVLLDLNGRVSDMYQVTGIPTSVFIDSQGVVQDIHVGTMPVAELFLSKIPK